MKKDEILKDLKERMKDHIPGTCNGCPLFIYANIYRKKSVYEIDCLSDYERLLKVLNLRFKKWEGCLWLYNYISNAKSTREVVKI